MSHVVGEVTYVELFKDAEGKSRVSDMDNMLLEGLMSSTVFILSHVLYKVMTLLVFLYNMLFCELLYTLVRYWDCYSWLYFVSFCQQGWLVDAV